MKRQTKPRKPRPSRAVITELERKIIDLEQELRGERRDRHAAQELANQRANALRKIREMISLNRGRAEGAALAVGLPRMVVEYGDQEPRIEPNDPPTSIEHTFKTIAQSLGYVLDEIMRGTL